MGFEKCFTQFVGRRNGNNGNGLLSTFVIFLVGMMADVNECCEFVQCLQWFYDDSDFEGIT